jgi:hypothetical protein
MKRSELRNIIKEEIKKVLKEGAVNPRAEANLPTNSFIFESKQPTLVDTWYAIPGWRVYKVVVEFDDGSKEKFRTLKDAEAKYNLEGVKETETEFDVS